MRPAPVAILIPALNEAASLPTVLAGLPAGARVIVCDNGSTDGTPQIAAAAGAEVVHEPRRGYGSAILKGMEALRADPPAIVVIWDGDASVDPQDLDALLRPIRDGQADMVLGDRTTLADPGALTPQQRWGNALATRLIGWRSGRYFADMGPFRAIRWEALTALGMRDPTWGWNVEMQMKAARGGMRVVEVPVRCRVRIGESKISGTVRGAVRAGGRILQACWRYG